MRRLPPPDNLLILHRRWWKSNGKPFDDKRKAMTVKDLVDGLRNLFDPTPPPPPEAPNAKTYVQTMVWEASTRSLRGAWFRNDRARK